MALLGELSLGVIVSRIAAVLVYAALQGFLLAGIARLLGDARPQYDGRLTLNPFVQVSAWGVVSGALFALSWCRPMRFAPESMRFGKWTLLLVVALGLAAMIVAIPASDLLRPLLLLLPSTAGYAAFQVLNQFQTIVVGSVLLNCLPVPGLAAGALWQLFWTGSERRAERLVPIGLALVFVAIVAGLLTNPASLVLPYLKA